MGSIDVAQRREHGFERLVAVKRLHAHLSEDVELVAMLRDEARVAGTIRHANVVSVLDVGQDEEGLYLVMELVEGHSLAQLMRADQESALPLQVALRIVRHVAAGLHAAHETRDTRGAPLRVVHRDVSPQNILVGYDGVARITDFGIAKARGAGTQTEAGLVKGKLRYMAPEQLRFDTLDRRTDVFALGIVLYEVVAGRHPYAGTPEEVARAILHDPTPDLGDECPELPGALVELVFRMLARDPALRPSDAEEVGRVLDAVLAEEVAREGVVEVADHLATHFGEARESLSRRIHDAVSAQVDAIVRDDVADRSAGALDAQPTFDATVPDAAAAGLAARGGGPRSHWQRVAVGAVATTLVGMGLWWWWRAGGSAAPSDATTELTSRVLGTQVLTPEEPMPEGAAATHGATLPNGELPNGELPNGVLPNETLLNLPSSTGSDQVPTSAAPTSDPGTAPRRRPPSRTREGTRTRPTGAWLWNHGQ